ncbi:MAG: GTP pyrophosphokinase [Anaerolineae bacterium]|jgi:(p)ppGpp synthase/HD superfamily hydrolase
MEDNEKMNELEKAIGVALNAHKGMVDKSGVPYILHPLHLMMQMDTDEARITAVLHDVVEDSDTTLDELAEMGFSTDVLQALELLTHDKENVLYQDYILGINGNNLARKVKLADLAHNMDQSRLPTPLTARDEERLQRYQLAWNTLSEA